MYFHHPGIGPHPMLEVARTMMKMSTPNDTIAPLWRKKRRRTIWPWLRPTTSACSIDDSSTTEIDSAGSSYDAASGGVVVLHGHVHIPPVAQ